jgi:hypothetical protein
MSHVREVTAARPRGAAPVLLGVVLLGTAVSVTLGALGATVGQPRSLPTFGFTSMQTFKSWLASLVLLLVLLQLFTALWIYGRVPWLGFASRAVHRIHRTSGVAAIALTLPIAWYCIYAFGFDTSTPRTAAHSVLGCVFYGAFVAKMAALRLRQLPRAVVPVLGGVLFTAFIGAWWLSALWWFQTVGWSR